MDPGASPHDQPKPAPSGIVQPEVVTPPVAVAPFHPPAPQVVVQRSGGTFWRFLAWIGWMGLICCIPIILGMMAAYQEYFDRSEGIQERFHSLSKSADNKIAIIDVRGLITDGDGFVKRQIERVRKDGKVKGIVVRVDSPGGTVTGSDYIYHHLKELKGEKDVPLVVSMGGMAASGGYYISMAVGDQDKSIYAEPTTTTGSIGVIIPHYNISGLLARFDIKDDSIASHPRKQLLSMTKEISPEDRKILQEFVNESFERFKGIVRDGRPKFEENPEALDKLATGEIFSATQAKAHGLVDEIGFVEDAIDRVIKLANLSPDDTRVVTFKRTPGLFDLLSSAQTSVEPVEKVMLNLSVPRAYYLVTTLPALVQSQFSPQ